MPRKPVKVQAVVKVKAYSVISDAIQGSAVAGLRRHYKHRDSEPSEEDLYAMGDMVTDYVMSALCEVLDFGDG